MLQNYFSKEIETFSLRLTVFLSSKKISNFKLNSFELPTVVLISTNEYPMKSFSSWEEMLNILFS